MALTKEDISIQGTGGYGTLSYIPEPGKNIEGTAGDIAAETATSGIVSSDASAELAGQAPNIVVPVNQSSDSVDRNINFETGDITGSTTGDINIYDEVALTGGATNTGGLTTLTDKIPDVLKPSKIGFALNLAKPGLGVLYNLIQAKRQEQQVQDLIDQQTQLNLQSRLDDTPENEGFTSVADQEFAETGDYDVYSDTPTGPVGAQFGDPTYADPGVDAEENQPTYTAPAPTVDYGYDANYGYQDSGSDSDDSSSGGTTGEGYGGGYGSDYGFAVGGIVRLRKNKQNSRIHDRRKRLAMGGIASLHG